MNITSSHCLCYASKQRSIPIPQRERSNELLRLKMILKVHLEIFSWAGYWLIRKFFVVLRNSMKRFSGAQLLSKTSEKTVFSGWLTKVRDVVWTDNRYF